MRHASPLAQALLSVLLASLAIWGCSHKPHPTARDGVVLVPDSGHGSPGSAPVQPIFFMHSVHAGTNKIACLYCHSYADRSAVANVPATSTCMNCHKFVRGSNPQYSAEIAKLVDFSDRGQPIPWVRVHKLPDHVYFIHKRHVKAGMQCQTCHGPVETMDRVYQYPPLTMGWCVTCHKANLANARFATSIDCYTCHR